MTERTFTLEVCVDSIECAIAAERGGASRIELCDNLAEDGTTPSIGLISEAVTLLAIPVNVMIRPRGGDSVYSDREFSVMLRDVQAVRALGAHGVVFGILTADGRIDTARAKILAAAARPLDITFHRAFDEVSDHHAAIDAIRDAGIGRILTSGGSPSVSDGFDALHTLAARAGDAVSIMPGGGVTGGLIPQLLSIPGIHELHVSGAAKRSVVRTAPNTGAVMQRKIVDAGLVAALLRAMNM
jgi:copper homeostasis protein